MPRRRKRRWNNSSVMYAMVLVVLAAALASQYRAEQATDHAVIPELPERRAYHAHVDFLVVMNNNEVDFSRQEYDAADPRIHIHIQNFEGDRVIHVHSEEASIGMFFSSIGMEFNSSCFRSFCNNGTHSLKFFVNEQANSEYGNYRPADLDRILVSYGPEDDVTGQIEAVSSFACISSGSCDIPEEAVGRILYN